MEIPVPVLNLRESEYTERLRPQAAAIPHADIYRYPRFIVGLHRDCFVTLGSGTVWICF